MHQFLRVGAVKPGACPRALGKNHIDCLQHFLGGAVGNGEINRLGKSCPTSVIFVSEELSRFFKGGRIGALETEDRLLGVADHKQRAARSLAAPRSGKEFPPSAR